MTLTKAEYTTQLQLTPEYEAAFQKELSRYQSTAHRVALQKVCKHPPEFHEYWNDPSGNNGGGWECTFCGADL